MKIYDKLKIDVDRRWDPEYIPEAEGHRPLAETEIDINVGGVFLKDGTAYVLTSIRGREVGYAECLPNQGVFVDGREPINYRYVLRVTCPYCGYRDNDSWELQEDDGEYDCKFCGSVFAYQREVTVEYHSQPVKQATVVAI